MSRSQGYILLHRKLMNNPIYFSEPFCKNAAWVDLILLANHRENVSMVRGIPIKVPRGMVGWSAESLAQRWRWSRGKVNRYLNYLKSVQQIDIINTGAMNLVSILKYEEYQNSSNKQSTKRTADGQQTVQEQRMKKNEKERGLLPGYPAAPQLKAVPLNKIPS